MKEILRKNMNILIVGRGWTGRKMMEELIRRDHIVTMCSHKLAIEELDKHRHSYDWVINCAGMTGSPNVDACELDREGTTYANAIFPAFLYKAAVIYKAAVKNEDSEFGLNRLFWGTRFAHFSSGCIYQGEINHVYDDPNYFGSIYSVTKGVSDLYLKDRALVFRIRMPFTGVDEKKNYLTKVINYAKNGKLIDSGLNSLTDLDEAVRVACDLIEKNETGPVNLVNDGSVTMHELVEMLGLENVSWFTEEEFKAATLASRSTCTIPSHPAMRPVREALEEAIRKLKNT
jgi:dTDP-4-dehydrorhamnose reductase